MFLICLIILGHVGFVSVNYREPNVSNHTLFWQAFKMFVVQVQSVQQRLQVSPTLVLMDGGVELDLLTPLAGQATDAVVLAFLPIDADSSWKMEFQICKMMAESQADWPCRRLTLLFSKAINGCRTQSILIIGASTSFPESSMRGRLALTVAST